MPENCPDAKNALLLYQSCQQLSTVFCKKFTQQAFLSSSVKNAFGTDRNQTNIISISNLQSFMQKSENPPKLFGGLSVSKKSTRSRGTNTITAAKPCSAFFPRFPLFNRKPAPQKALPLLTAGFLAWCHSGGACPPA